MMGAFWILLVTVVSGVILYIHHRLTDKEEAESVSASQEQVVDRPEGCCGQHAVCEKESLLTGIDNKIIYYEDEELDEYKGLGAEDYTEEQIDQFRDVLYTLKPDEIAGWARSIKLRGIELPAPVKDELIMLAAEAREVLHETQQV